MPDEKTEQLPHAEIKLNGRTVERSRVEFDWGHRLQWRVSLNGAVIATPDARATATYTHPDAKPGAYEIVLETYKHEGYKSGSQGKFIEISNKVAYKV